MSLRSLVSRLDRWAGRFNRWFGSSAIAVGAEWSGDGKVQTVHPASVEAIRAEIERQSRPDDETADRPRP